MIYFVGAGSGDPEYITLKAYRLLQRADLIIYTGSLVNEEILEYAKPDATCVSSSSLNLQEIVEMMIAAHQREQLVIRLHTGDPSLYSAIGEQMSLLEAVDIPYTVIPGISSFLAAAASLQRQYTIPGETQTLIITRMPGRTPVPESESIATLASHKASMAIFLSVEKIEEVVEQLRQSYDMDTPVAVVEKASWPTERILRGSLADIADKTRAAGIKKTALILVGNFLEATGNSKLYDRNFVHEYRDGR